MKPRELLNVIVAGFGLYCLWRAFGCAVAITLMNTGVYPDDTYSKGYYMVWFVIGLVLGILLLRFGARFLSWLIPKNWPNSDESKPEHPKE